MENERDFGTTSLGCEGNAGMGGNESQGFSIGEVRPEAPATFTTNPFLSLGREERRNFMYVVASNLGLPSFVYGQVNQLSPIPPLCISPQNIQGRSDQFISSTTQSFSVMSTGLVRPYYEGITQSYMPQYGVPQGANSSNLTSPTHFAPQYGMPMLGMISNPIYSMPLSNNTIVPQGLLMTKVPIKAKGLLSFKKE